MPGRLILCLLSAALLLPAAASAAPVVGISESNPTMFEDKSFLALRATTTRLLTAYDVVPAAARGDAELERRVAPYLANAAAAGVEPLVTFQHSAGAWEDCPRDPALRQCRLPGAVEYRSAVRAFLERFPSVTLIAPWNEANHAAQPTARDPRMAARFTNIVADVCRALARPCRLVVADVLDQADRAAARRPTFTATARWIRAFRSALRVPRGVCGLHNYSDVNRFRRDGTRALMRALGCREYWLTETGGVFRFGGFWTAASERVGGCASAAACQLKATEFMFAQAARIRRIKRIYVHTWYSGSRQRFDAGLVRGINSDWLGRPRPAYYVVRDHVWAGPEVRVPVSARSAGG
jgi:hypothetical protein